MEWILTTKEVDNVMEMEWKWNGNFATREIDAKWKGNGMETEWKWNGEIMSSSCINIWKWKWNGMEMEMEKELKICRMEFPFGKFLNFIRFHSHSIPLNSIPFHGIPLSI